MLRGKSNPGDGINKKEIFEVWGDMVTNAANSGPVVIQSIYAFFEGAGLIEYFKCRKLQAAEDGRPFIVLEWKDLQAHIDARPFGTHLDVYAIVVIRKGGFSSPDPAARIAELEGWERRNLQIFQTLLKSALDQALIHLDEGEINL